MTPPNTNPRLAILLIGGVIVAACSAESDTQRDGVLGRSTQELLTAVGNNYRVVPSTLTAQEISVAFQPGCSARGNWVVGFNNITNGVSPPAQLAGWATSTTTLGDTWSVHTMVNAFDFGSLGPSPVSGSPFASWRGDPALSAVTDPSINAGGKRIIYGNVGLSAAGNFDIVVAFSDDCGATNFHNAGYLNVPPAAGANADRPFIATDAIAPFGTFASWTTGNTSWLTQFSYSAAGVLNVSPAVSVPAAPAGKIRHTSVAVGHATLCTGASHEIAYVAFSTTIAARCPFNGLENPTTDQGWYVAPYDTQDHVWLLTIGSISARCPGATRV
jgi:hypothetical protein